MPDTPPDRLANDPRSPFFKEDVLKRDIGVRFNGVEKSNVEEYCVSEGWIRVEAGKSKDRYGNPMTVKLTGKVEPYFKNEKSEKAEQAAKPEKAAAKPEKAAAKPEKAAAKPEKAAAKTAKSAKADKKKKKK
jgi:hypothetical protein